MNIFVAGHNGMVGSAIIKHLKTSKDNNIIVSNRDELNLLDQDSVKKFFEENKIDQVYLAAAKVGGIHANDKYPATFIYENIMIQSNIIHSAYTSKIKKLLFLGSSCIYPKNTDQPIKEDRLLTGKLESTNEPYAIAKIAGIKMCESYNRQFKKDYRSIMPTNLYGPNDNFHDENSHVIPAMINRFHEAKINNYKEVVVWGTGNPRREFLHVDDMALASIHIMNLDHETYSAHILPMSSHINVGSGIDITIKELAFIISRIVGFDGKIVFDISKPDGTPRKVMDTSLINELGWRPTINLENGIKDTYSWYLNNYSDLRK